MSSSKKGVKMSLGEFIWDSNPASSLPTGPRGTSDSHRRFDDDNERRGGYREERGGSWRGGGGGGGYQRDDNRGGGKDDNARGSWRGGGGFRDDRGGDDRAGGSWRGGGGGHRDEDNRGGDDRGQWRGGGGSYRDGGDDRPNWRGSGGHRDDRGGDDRAGGSWRGGGQRDDRTGDDRTAGSWRGSGSHERGDDRGGRWRSGGGGFRDERDGVRGSTGGASSRSGGRSGEEPAGERPRLQLKARTNATTSQNATEGSQLNTSEEPDVADTASKLDKLAIQNEGKSDQDDTQEPSLDSEDVSDAKNKTDEARTESDGKTETGRKLLEPKVINSRAAALEGAPDSRREKSGRRDRGPPPVRNRRIEQLAEEERESRNQHGPPPTTNSRFAAAADADRSNYRDEPRGPPPVANSRFAAAAALAEQESRDREERRHERQAFYGRDDRREDRRPMQQNSRFAAAVAADSDYVDREERQRRTVEREHDRFHDGGNYRRRENDRRESGYEDQHEDAEAEDARPTKSSVADLLKPKAPPPEDNILRIPTKPAPEHEANMLQVPTKPHTKELEENVLQPPKQKETDDKKVAQEEVTNAPPSVSDEQREALLNEFINGGKLGDDLREWCALNRTKLPSVETLVFTLLLEKEKLNPDIECGWAEHTKFGAALLDLVRDDIGAQMEVLWAIQRYCDKLGNPKLNDEYVIQSMFRAVYKHDLADVDAFIEWKEDESEEHEQGKLKAVIQTVDWFNWLEEDDEGEEEYDDEEEGEYE